MCGCLGICPSAYSIGLGVSTFIQASPVSTVCGLSLVIKSNVAGMGTRGGIARELMPQLGQLDSDLISQAAQWAGRQREAQPGVWAISSFDHRNSFCILLASQLEGGIPEKCWVCASSVLQLPLL